MLKLQSLLLCSCVPPFSDSKSEACRNNWQQLLQPAGSRAEQQAELHYSLEFKRGETTSPLNVGRRSSVYLGSIAFYFRERKQEIMKFMMERDNAGDFRQLEFVYIKKLLDTVSSFPYREHHFSIHTLPMAGSPQHEKFTSLPSDLARWNACQR